MLPKFPSCAPLALIKLTGYCGFASLFGFFTIQWAERGELIHFVAAGVCFLIAAAFGKWFLGPSRG